MARFNIFTVGIPAVVIPEDLKYRDPNSENNYVDTLVHDKLHKLRMTPSELCSDEVFVRKLLSDITGLLPTLEESKSFIGDQDEARAKLIDPYLRKRIYRALGHEICRAAANTN